MLVFRGKFLGFRKQTTKQTKPTLVPKKIGPKGFWFDHREDVINMEKISMSRRVYIYAAVTPAKFNIAPKKNPIPSMYGIFTYIWLFLMVKYGKCR